MFCLVVEGMLDDFLYYNLICCECWIYWVFYVYENIKYWSMNIKEF